MNPIFTILYILGVSALHASPANHLDLQMGDKKMSIYGIKTADKNATNGIGLFYSTQNLKIKAERSDYAFKTGAMVQSNLFQSPMYVSLGGNYMNQESLRSDLPNNNFNQYSGALAVGYFLKNDLYVEAGKSISKLNESQSCEKTRVNDSLSQETFAQLGKRFDIPIGTIETHIKGNQIYNTLSRKVENYEGSVHYYLNDAIKLGYAHSINQNDTTNGYSLDFGYFSTLYTKNMMQDTYNVTLGLKANFTDITKLSTYKPTTRVKKQLSKPQQFENMIMQKNMNLRK